MKTLSKNKQLFLRIVEVINKQLKNSEHHLSKEEAITLYDKEIAPYGYPSHQALLIEKGMSMYQFNSEVVNTAIKNKSGGQYVGQGFGKGFLCPTYYITDDLANSLIQTEPPKHMELNLEVLPSIEVTFSKKFDKYHTISMSQNSEGITVDVYYRRVVPDSGLDIPMKFFIPFKGDGHCMFCDTREHFHKNLLEYNYFQVMKSSHIIARDDIHAVTDEFVGKGVASLSNKGQVKFRIPVIKHEKAEEIINEFIKDLNRPYRFVINLLCLMTQQPEIITVQSPTSNYTATNSKGFGSEKINNVPNVHWLGEHFTTRVVESKTNSNEPQGCSPKKSHWRRGHWHTILQGPGRKQRTMKWFKPTFIKGHKQVDLIKEET